MAQTHLGYPKIRRQRLKMTRICGLLILTYTAYPYCCAISRPIGHYMSLPPAAAPLGVPVVPEVYMITAISSGSGLVGNSFSDLEALGEAWFNDVQCARTLQVGELVHSQILHQDSVWPSAMVLWCSPGSLAEDSWSVLV